MQNRQIWNNIIFALYLHFPDSLFAAFATFRTVKWATSLAEPVGVGREGEHGHRSTCICPLLHTTHVSPLPPLQKKLGHLSAK